MQQCIFCENSWGARPCQGIGSRAGLQVTEKLWGPARLARRATVRGPKFDVFETSNPDLRPSDRAVTLSVSVARLRTMPDFFSILLDEVSASVELVFGVVDQADNVVAEIPGLIFLG